MGKKQLRSRHLGAWDDDDVCFSNERDLRARHDPESVQPQGRKARTRRRRHVARRGPPILRLPSELRVKIFQYVFTDAHVRFAGMQVKSSKPPSFKAELISEDGEALLFCCQQFYLDSHSALPSSIRLHLCPNVHQGHFTDFVRQNYLHRVEKLVLTLPRRIDLYLFVDDFPSLLEVTLVHDTDHYLVCDWRINGDPYTTTCDRWLKRIAKHLPISDSAETTVGRMSINAGRRFKVYHEVLVRVPRNTPWWDPSPPELRLTVDFDTDTIVRRVVHDEAHGLEKIWEDDTVQTWKITTYKSGIAKEFVCWEAWI